jgi:hypothetical protein
MDIIEETVVPTCEKSSSHCSSNVFRSPLTKTFIMAAVYEDGCITVWEIAAGSDTATVKHRLWPDCRKDSISRLKFDASGARLAACSNALRKNKLYIFDLDSAQLLSVFIGIDSGPLLYLANPSFSRGGDRIAFRAYHYDVYGYLQILDSATGTMLCTIDDDAGHCVHTYIFIDDDRLIITCGRTSRGNLSAVRCWCAS